MTSLTHGGRPQNEVRTTTHHTSRAVCSIKAKKGKTQQHHALWTTAAVDGVHTTINTIVRLTVGEGSEDDFFLLLGQRVCGHPELLPCGESLVFTAPKVGLYDVIWAWCAGCLLPRCDEIQ